MKYKIYILILLAIVLSSCTKNDDLPPKENNYIVAGSYIPDSFYYYDFKPDLDFSTEGDYVIDLFNDSIPDLKFIYEVSINKTEITLIDGTCCYEMEIKHKNIKIHIMNKSIKICGLVRGGKKILSSNNWNNLDYELIDCYSGDEILDCSGDKYFLEYTDDYAYLGMKYIDNNETKYGWLKLDRHIYIYDYAFSK